ncbi:MAG: aspartate/glutamate racemase family protein [Alphaproteobacteria bacterium]
MHGWRARIGLLVPSINTTMEPEVWRTAPAGVTVHTARIATPREGHPDALRNMENTSVDACRLVAQTEPHVVMYGCTSGSFFEGPDFETRIRKTLGDIAKCPVVATAGAAANALRARGIKSVSVVTPYVQLTNERLTAFLNAFGITVARLQTFDMLDMYDHAKIQPSDVYQKAREAARDDAEAVFISCTQVRALEVVDMLERDTGKPVISANQASIWEAYTHLGIDPGLTAHGSLLRDMPALPAEPARARAAAE